MSTRSNIVIEDPKTKKVKSIYVHSDGYPYGVGKCLVEFYSDYKKAKELFNHGDASYLGDTIEECSFYSRDWDREEEPAREYKDEWIYMDRMQGDIFIEYIYLFKHNRWYVSTQKHTTAKDGYDRGTLFYYTKFEPVIMNKEYIKYQGKHEKHAEVNMIKQIGDLLKSKGFSDDNVMIQGGNAKKSN